MIYPEDFEQKIGFSAIRQMLCEKCVSVPGKEFVGQISFSSDSGEISRRLQQTDEFCRLLTDGSEFSMGGISDVRHALRKIRVEGLFFDTEELGGLRVSLETFAQMSSFFRGENENRYPRLREMFGESCADEVLKRINVILDKYGDVKDSASPKLQSVRREKFSVQGSISRILQTVLHRAQTDGYVDKESSPVMRDGRLVIPVNPSYKRHIKGIILDESSSGKTVFVEPTEAVEANNRLRELEGEERREIIRILLEFSDFLRPFADEILALFDVLGELDMIQAKAKLALDIDAVLPKTSELPLVNWRKARHPLLFLSHRRQNKNVVPLNVELNEKRRILLISGPNAGGKSVCLKTVGLLQYMFQSGLLVPADESSTFGIFGKIFIDIGDEQSIEDDLSTYSSHLRNMKHFLRNSDRKTLILIDEFGSGTEPRIGGAIAEVLLEQFNKNGVFGMVTTHYTNLKIFAENAEGVENGAMLYNRHQMQPLFELQIGIPGSSFAVEIARKIGLPESIIEAATQKAGDENIKLDKYFQDVVRDKHYWEEKRRQIRQKEKHTEELAEKYSRELESINKQKKEVIRNAQNEAKELIRNANAQIENTIRRIKESNAEKEETKQARVSLKKFDETIQTEKNEDSVSQKIEKIKRNNCLPKAKKQDLGKRALSVGDYVRLQGQTSIGTILELQGNQAVVAFGQLRMAANVKRLETVSGSQAKKERRQVMLISSETQAEIRQKKLNFKQEIDVRGMRADEALQAVMYFMDDALTVNVSQVRILHGTGTGALRQVIRQYLSTLAGVESFADEHVQFGGAGITVVNLKD